jgi:uncharacterized protein (DUF1697 family)
MARFVALLRGINVTGRNKVGMAELRAAAGELGWSKVDTYIQSGNLVAEAPASQAELEAQLEEAIQERFGISVPVVIRSAAEWPAYAVGNPFPEAAEREPNRLMLLLSKAPPRPDAADALQQRARDGELVRLVGDALWIHYPGGAGTSKLTPALIDRLVGSSATARNWRTVLKLQDMLQQRSS